MSVIVIVLLICLIGTMWLQWWLVRKNKDDAEPPTSIVMEGEDNLAKLVNMMREDRDKRAQEDKDQELVEFAKRKNRNQPPCPPQSSLLHGEDLIQRGDGDLIPFDLPESEKQILRDFYRKV